MALRKSARRSRSLWKSKIWFLAPSLAGVGVFVLIPFLDMVRRSFYNSVTKEFSGIKNYEQVFANQAFRLALKNTVRFLGTGLPLLILLSLMISMMLYRRRYSEHLKTIFLFPMAVPTVTVAIIWKIFFYRDGILNMGLSLAGRPPVDWLGSDASFWVLVICYLWKNTGYTIVLWLAGLKTIPVSLIEAAKVDGASGWKCFRYVILPELRPVFYTITILSLLNSFKIFREAYLVAGAYPQQDMYLLQHLFNNWFTNLDVDQMSAAVVCISAVLAFGILLLERMGDGGKK
ncbi:MAG: sugar ABC transporter permease [Roseburia sp.]|nr:sugar ABC transporter permease [Roseburia sp.]